VDRWLLPMSRAGPWRRGGVFWRRLGGISMTYHFPGEATRRPGICGWQTTGLYLKGAELECRSRIWSPPSLQGSMSDNRDRIASVYPVS